MLHLDQLLQFQTKVKLLVTTNALAYRTMVLITGVKKLTVQNPHHIFIVVRCVLWFFVEGHSNNYLQSLYASYHFRWLCNKTFAFALDN